MFYLIKATTYFYRLLFLTVAVTATCYPFFVESNFLVPLLYVPTLLLALSLSALFIETQINKAILVAKNQHKIKRCRVIKGICCLCH